jgi:hypothetical protein
MAVSKCMTLNMKLASLETMQENMCAQRLALSTGRLEFFKFLSYLNFMSKATLEILFSLAFPNGGKAITRSGGMASL